MTARLVPSFLIFYLLIINHHQSVIAQNYTDIYDTNITHETYVYPIFTCETPSSIDLSKFQCKLLDHFSIIKQSCVTPSRIDLSKFQCKLLDHFSIIEQFCITQPFTCFDQNYIGVHCNISNNACDMAQLCYNDGTCHSNNSLSEKFICECPLGYSGIDCSKDNRICKNNTCWHEGECKVMNASISYADEFSFDCVCNSGYDGTHCEILSNMCANITCQNNGICDYSHLSWSCKCLSSDLYSGEYCQHKSTRLIIKQVLSKSFAFIAILAIAAVFIFVITMDILKYVFKIDPVDRERQLMRSDREKNRLEKINRRKQGRKVALKFYYIA